MDAAATSSPDLSVEIPADSTKTPQWFEEALATPPQKVNEAYLFDYMAYHSLKEVEGGWTWKFHPSVFERIVRR